MDTDTPSDELPVHYVIEMLVDSPMVEHVQVDLQCQDEESRDLPPFRLWMTQEQARELAAALLTYANG